ncbi:hypothetical protein INR49_001981 [Caranx melampygus]|nr:hypothetical protein INR49_001981 [Caranx melampygus]
MDPSVNRHLKRCVQHKWFMLSVAHVGSWFYSFRVSDLSITGELKILPDSPMIKNCEGAPVTAAEDRLCWTTGYNETVTGNGGCTKRQKGWDSAQGGESGDPEAHGPLPPEHCQRRQDESWRRRRGGGGGGGGGGGQKHSFQDGFSTCLQRAAQFLGPEGKGLWLGAALDASFAARFARSDSDSAGVQRRTEARPSSTSSLPQTKSILRLLRQKTKHRLSTGSCSVNTSVHPYQRLVRKGFPRVPQQPQKQSLLEFRAVSRVSKQSPTQSCPLSQTLWRPWP